MDLRSPWKPLLLVVGGFLACFFLPVGSDWFRGAIWEALGLVRRYAREHVILCLVPAFFLAGAGHQSSQCPGNTFCARFA